MRLTARFLFLPALAMAGLLFAQAAQAAPQSVSWTQNSNTITAVVNTGTFDGEQSGDAIPTVSGITDFSSYGTGGSWFFNFDQATNTQSTGNPEFGEVDDLPSWITVDKTSAALDRTLSDGATIDTSFGGQSGWSTITLPTHAGGATGVSGAAMAPASAGNSANVFESMFVNLPASQSISFTMSIVVDNTNGDYPTDKRMKVRALVGASEVNMRLNNLPTDNNPDIYSFDFANFKNTDQLRLQLRNNLSGGIGASIAGIMFDNVSIVPEPTSIALLMLGTIACGGLRRRRL